MTKLLGALFLLSLAGAASAGFLTLRLSERITDQETQIERLRGEITALRERSAGSDREVSGIETGSFDLPAATVAAGSAPVADAAAAETAERALVGRLIRDDRVIAELARQMEGRVEPAPTFLASPAFKEGVRTTIDEIREEERALAQEEREARMVERTQERAKQIAERLALSPGAAEQLTEILVSGVEARRDAFALVESGQIPREEVRQVMREQREETNTQLQALLTPAQYVEYQKMEEEQGPGRGIRGDFGGPAEIFFGGGAAIPVPAASSPAAAGGVPPAPGSP